MCPFFFYQISTHSCLICEKKSLFNKLSIHVDNYLIRKITQKHVEENTVIKEGRKSKLSVNISCT